MKNKKHSFDWNNVILLVGTLLWIFMPMMRIGQSITRMQAYNQQTAAYMEIRLAALALQNGNIEQTPLNNAVFHCLRDSYGLAVDNTNRLEGI